eukprot:s502_g33.t1
MAVARWPWQRLRELPWEGLRGPAETFAGGLERLGKALRTDGSTWLKALSFARIWRSRHAERCMVPSGAWTEWRLDIDCEWLLPEEEMAALEDLSAALTQAWSRYPGGSLEEEEKLLQKRLTSKRRTAIVVRRDEKYTLWKLQRFVGDAKSRLERLRRDGADRSWRQYIFAVPRDEL